jgi:beta-1,4-mannosyltransferase
MFVRSPATRASRSPLRVLAYPYLSMNPYTAQLYDHMDVDVREFSLRREITKAFDGEIFHVHWPELWLGRHSLPVAAAKIKAFLNLIDRMRERGVKLIWTAHNLHAHEHRHPKLEHWFWHQFVSRVDSYVTLTEGGLIAARNRFAALVSVPGFAIPHGHYRDVYPCRPQTGERGVLGISPDAKVILSFGAIRRYKNIPHLAECFRRMQSTDVNLIIAGRPSDGIDRDVRQACADDPKIRQDLREIPGDEVFLYFRAADLVALAYTDVLNSGTALLALSFDRPILAPACGAMLELRDQIGPEWVHIYKGELGPDVLRSALHWALFAPRPARAPLDHLSWDAIADQTLRVYHAAINNNRPSGRTESARYV